MISPSVSFSLAVEHKNYDSGKAIDITFLNILISNEVP